MKLPIRLRVRTLLVVVGLVALTLGASIGWVKHRDLDQGREHEAMLFRQIVWHQQQADYCRGASASGLPYSKPDRLRLFTKHVQLWRSLNPPLSGWPAEAKVHDGWASSLMNAAENLHVRNLAGEPGLSIR